MLRAPIPKSVRMLMGYEIGIPIFVGMVAFACFFQVPLFIINVLPRSVVEALAHHPVYGIIFLAPCAAWMIWFAIQVAARIQIWIDEVDDIDGWVMLMIAMTLIVLYKMLVDGLMQRLKALHLTEPAVLNVQNAIEGWIVLWFILVTYIGKAPWDRARGQAVQRVKKARN